MSNASYQTEIKSRVPRQMRRELEAIARGRDLKTSDIVREAIRFYLEKRQVKEAA